VSCDVGNVGDIDDRDVGCGFGFGEGDGSGFASPGEAFATSGVFCAFWNYFDDVSFDEFDVAVIEDVCVDSVVLSIWRSLVTCCMAMVTIGLG
jgi:hypothetical protein